MIGKTSSTAITLLVQHTRLIYVIDGCSFSNVHKQSLVVEPVEYTMKKMLSICVIICNTI